MELCKHLQKIYQEEIRKGNSVLKINADYEGTHKLVIFFKEPIKLNYFNYNNTLKGITAKSYLKDFRLRCNECNMVLSFPLLLENNEDIEFKNPNPNVIATKHNVYVEDSIKKEGLIPRIKYRKLIDIWNNTKLINVVYMIASFLLYNVFFLLVLFLQLIGMASSWEQFEFTFMAYILSFPVISLIYGIVFATKEQKIVVICSIYFIITFFSLMVFSCILNMELEITSAILLSSIIGATILTIIPLASSSIKQFKIKRERNNR